MNTQSLLESIRSTTDPRMLAPALTAKAMGITMGELSELLGVHRNTLRMSPSSDRVQAALVDAVRVLAAAVGLSGDRDRAVFWFRNYPIADFGHRTAMMLVRDGKAQAVIDYIESAGAGATG